MKHILQYKLILKNYTPKIRCGEKWGKVLTGVANFYIFVKYILKKLSNIYCSVINLHEYRIYNKFFSLFSSVRNMDWSSAMVSMGR